MTSTQSPPSKAALDSLSSRLWNGGKKGSALPPLGTRTVGSGPNPPPAEQQPLPSSVSASSSSSASATLPLPPLEQVSRPKPLTSEQMSKITYQAPKKRIVSQRHLEKWQHSDAFKEVLGLVMYCNDSVVGTKLNEEIKGQESQAIQSIITVLDRVAELVQETPAEKESTSRFGNPAFRTFYAKVQQESRLLHESIPGLRDEAIVEVERYFIECFGNEKRIDYGSGMELNFVCWL